MKGYSLNVDITASHIMFEYKQEVTLRLVNYLLDQLIESLTDTDEMVEGGLISNSDLISIPRQEV